MTHDVLRLNIRSEHPDEIPFHLEDGRHPDGSEARDAGSRTWPCSCGASSPVVSALGVSPLQNLSRILLAGSELPQRQKETPAESRGLGFD